GRRRRLAGRRGGRRRRGCRRRLSRRAGRGAAGRGGGRGRRRGRRRRLRGRRGGRRRRGRRRRLSGRVGRAAGRRGRGRWRRDRYRTARSRSRRDGIATGIKQATDREPDGRHRIGAGDRAERYLGDAHDPDRTSGAGVLEGRDSGLTVGATADVLVVGGRAGELGGIAARYGDDRQDGAVVGERDAVGTQRRGPDVDRDLGHELG